MGSYNHNIKGEFSSNGFKNDLQHLKGVLSMARSNNPNSASCQFFIMADDSTHLDGSYAAFGKVIDGLDEVDRIVNVKRDRGDKPIAPEVMVKFTVETFDVEYGEPVKV